jgi:hypothetical protein
LSDAEKTRNRVNFRQEKIENRSILLPLVHYSKRNPTPPPRAAWGYTLVALSFDAGFTHFTMRLAIFVLVLLHMRSDAVVRSSDAISKSENAHRRGFPRNLDPFSFSASQSSSPSFSITPSRSATQSPSQQISGTQSATQSNTDTKSPSSTLTKTPTLTRTQTASASQPLSQSLSPSRSISRSSSQSPSNLPCASSGIVSGVEVTSADSRIVFLCTCSVLASCFFFSRARRSFHWPSTSFFAVLAQSVRARATLLD